MKKQVSVGLLSILIAGGLDPLVGICQTPGLTESSRILNEAVHKNSGEEKMPEETSVNTDSITHSEVEDTKTTVPKADVVPESSEELSTLQETPSSQGGENSSEIKEDTANSTTSETAVKEETDEQNVQPKTTENIDDWMPDKALQKAVATSLGVAIDQITKESILNLRTLVGKGFGIVNLTGLEYAKKLGVIWLRDNQISDVSPLQNLTSLQLLDLVRNQISDISPLQNLTSLQHLDLIRNQISDVSPLQNLTSLQSLYLNDNQISDVSSLQNLKALQHLSLAANQISNISPLQNLTSLQYLHSDDNQISDISPLQNLTSLQTLYLNNNQISDISPLYNLYNLPVDRDIEIVAMNQHLQLPAVYVSNKNPYFISIESPIKNITSTKPVILSPLNTSVWTGVGQSGKVEWTGGAQVPAEGTFSTDWKFLDATDNRSLRFDGTYEQPYILSKVEINAHDSTLYTGDTWNAQDNFDSAKDKNGNPANFQDIQVTGSVDTSRPGKYKITYSYGGVQKEIEVTVLQKASNSDSNSNSGENKKNENPKTLRANEKEKALPSTGEKGSVWVFVSGVMFFIFASVLALLRFKKSK